MTAKRCICKRSSQYPICDGSHLNASWCSPPSTLTLSSIVLSSESIQAFGEWFAGQYQHTHFSQLPSTPSEMIQDIWILFDGTGLDLLSAHLSRIPHRNEYWIHVGHKPYSVQTTSPVNQIHYHLEDIDIEAFSLEELHPCTPETSPIQSIFVSHSIQDEHLLLPIFERLTQHHNVNIFLCANMTAGVDWYHNIETAIKECDVLWVCCSQGLTQSTFCAFEIGLAQGLNKPIRPIMIDNTPPPLFLQHQNMPSLSRLILQQPWLSKSQGLEMICRGLLFQND